MDLSWLTYKHEGDLSVWQMFQGMVLFICFLYLGAMIWLPTIPTQQDHPPQVLISRNTTNQSNIDIKWLGGTDAVFVGNFTVRINNGSWEEYDRPQWTGDLIATIPAKNNSTINVNAFNRAVNTYVPIGVNCV
jgi:hypothetical protein